MRCYRLQVQGMGGLPAVTGLVPYLTELGVSTLYLSPLLRARSGSTHGYDVVDPGQIDPAIGGERALRELASACRDAGLTLLLDIVPNHMAANHENAWWWSVLELGLASPHAAFFDIDWAEPREPVRGRVVLPILGRRYHDVLASGEFQVVSVGKKYILEYHDHILPLDVSSHPVLSHRDEGSQAEREATVDFLGRTGSEPEARTELDQLLTRQPYWLVHWRTAPEELNYRRFFNISHLVAVRMERDDVFRSWHALVSGLVRRLPVAGLRVDHVDGLSDPETYIDRLRASLDQAEGTGRRPVLLVEKILAPTERLPAGWKADGTTGYDFLAACDGLMVDAAGVDALGAAYAAFTGSGRSFASETRRAKRKAIRSHFRRDLTRLVDLALPLVRSDRRGRDLTRSEVMTALREITLELHVYRTYLGVAATTPDARAPLDEAVARARRNRRDLPAGAYDVLATVMTERQDGPGSELVRRWQQLTSAVMAKGVEDTAFYAYTPLVSLNEVGADPGRTPADVRDFHRFMTERARCWPRSLNTSSTHDTKRSEDVRARIHVLSEMPGEWERRVRRWHAWHGGLRERVRDVMVPTAQEEWLLYQTLVGIWPLEGREDHDLRDRLEAFVRKAAREAKIHTSWVRPNTAHEEALVRFMRRILDADRGGAFLDDLHDVHERTAFHGAINSLGMSLLKLAAPGAPDLYQGNELWRLDLVDPDNRRAVDWDLRRSMLDGLRAELGDRAPDGRVPALHLVSDLLDHWTDGRVKLLLTWRALGCRRRHRAVFEDGTYEALEPSGDRGRHIVAFARRSGSDWVVAVAPRLTTAITPTGTFPLGDRAWADTALPLPRDAPRTWRDEITGVALTTGKDGALPLSRILEHFPVALLHGRSETTVRKPVQPAPA